MKTVVKWSLLLSSLLLVMSGFSQTHSKLHYRFCKPSQQNILHSAKFLWQGDQVFLKTSSQSTESQTLHVLALMVQFQEDDDYRTTGNGQFDLSTTTDTLINAPPHNQNYFEKQLTALSNYYGSISRGKLQLDYDVYPTVFTLDKKMTDYNPGTEDSLMEKGLAELFRDAVQMGDAEGINFSDYQSIIIFHAGVGRDIDLGLDYSYSDIPSAFLTLSDLQKFLAPNNTNFEGIPVQNGSHIIKEGIILPETQSQEDIEIGMLGTMTLMFGFQLGLPALWNTETGVTGIGRWGMMDQGSGNYLGLIPAEPCAWSKVFLGWEDPIVIKEGVNLKVACSKASNPNKIYKVPIHDKEYYLIENRQYDIDGDSTTYGLDSDGNPVKFASDGTISMVQSDVIVHVNEYDYGLPGSGILIWHIDEAVIEANYASNTVNNDIKRKGVDLEEADGAQDLGELYGFLSGGYGAENGVMHDAWFEDNEVHLEVNNSASVVFGSKTYPDTRSNDKGNTYIEFSGFSEIDTVMQFSVTNGLTREHFPVDLGDGLTPIALLTADLDGDDEKKIIVTTYEGHVLIWNADGSPFVETTQNNRDYLGGGSDIVSIPLVHQYENGISVSPVIADLDKDGDDEILIPTGSMVYFIDCHEDGHLNAINILLSGENDDITALAYIENQTVIGTASGTIWGPGYPEEYIYQIQFNAGSINSLCQSEYNGENIIAVLSEQGELSVLDLAWNRLSISATYVDLGPHGFISSGWLTEHSTSFIATQGLISRISHLDGSTIPIKDANLISTAQVIADMNLDNFNDIVLTAKGQFVPVQKNGVTMSHGMIPGYERDLELSSPIVVDIDSDGALEMIASTSTGIIEAYQINGEMHPDFPLALGSRATLAPLIDDLDGDNKVELLAVSDNGYLNVYNFTGSTSAESMVWPSVRYDMAGTAFNPVRKSTPQPKTDWMPTNLVYNYPNPAEGNETVIRYRLEKDATVSIRIFDLGGDLVDSFSGPGLAQVENEVNWNLSDIDSGVYFCQVKAKTESTEKTVTIKIAVAK